MENFSEISLALLTQLEKLWSEQSILDFDVKICDSVIGCHRVILGACSEFFRCLFRSNMKETKENMVTLVGIAVETFQLILKCLYTGVNVLTEENVIDIWLAVDQLQIDFMINICEKFAVNIINLNNWDKIHKTAKLLNSKPVLDSTRTFMMKNFSSITSMKTFIDLSAETIIEVIQDQDLNCCNEDFVLESVIRWVKCESDSYDSLRSSRLETEKENTRDVICKTKYIDHQTTYICNLEPNDEPSITHYGQEINRQFYLIDLLKAVRLCLVRPAILSHVFNLELLKKNRAAKDLIFKATLYHTEDFRHGQWLSAAIHRNCSEFDHYGVYTLNDEVVRAFCFSSEKWFTLKTNIPLRYQTELCVFNNELFCSGLKSAGSETSQLYVYREGVWIAVADIPGNKIISLSHEKCIYVVNLLNKHLYRVNPKSNTKIPEEYCRLENLENIKYAMSFQGKIIFFSRMINNGTDETAVHSFEVSSKKLIHLINLDGPADNLISFSDDNHTYILQNNGVLWTISTCESKAIIITKIRTLWKFNKTLRGGATYKGKLMILYTYVENATSEKMASNIRGMFSQINYRSSITTCSKLIPATLAKANLNVWTS